MEQRTLGDYHILKRIGQGTLGTVYLAEHRFMKRQYVLKTLSEELAADRGFIQRFEDEVGSLASLDHPNIVKIHNISFAQGQYFLVTDCIVDELGETTNLAKYVMGHGNLEEEEIFHLLLQVAAALDYAHTKKMGSKEALVHRGLKLNNILVGKKRQGVEIYLSDFGLSRIIGLGAVLTRTYKNVAEALGIGLQSFPQKGEQERYPVPPIDQQKLLPLHVSFLQNYAFLAPEQKRLDMASSIDHKVDTYAFGVLAYFLLMNEWPEGFFDLPSSRAHCRYQWDRLLLSCLQQQPAKRPEVLLDILEEIRPGKEAQVIVEHLNVEHLQQAGPQQGEAQSLTDFQKVKKESTFALPLNVMEEKMVSVAQGKSSSTSLKPLLQMPQLERPQIDPDPGAVFQVSASVKAYHPEPKDVDNVKPLLTEMVIIPGGIFSRGSHDGNRDEMPKHQVTLLSFAIDIHPVTNEQFVRFLEVMGGEKDSHHNDIIRLRDSRIKRSGGKLSIESGYNKHPVVGVTWYGAVAYARWIGKRLPTEAEWEVAAKGGQESILYPTGDEIAKTQANFFSSDTTAVMSYMPNLYGLYDMAGNVYEWCHDWYGYNYYEVSIQEPESPHGPLQGVYRVLRGGCWKSLKEDLLCCRRHRNNPGTVNGTYGFRCAANAQLSNSPYAKDD